MHLTPSDIPEFPDSMTYAAREEVLRDGANRVSYNAAFGFWALAFAIECAIIVLLWWLFPAMNWFLRVGLLIAASAVAAYPLVHWQRRVFHRGIRAVLRARGVNTCEVCGYNLVGLPESQGCPECGLATARMSPIGTASSPTPSSPPPAPQPCTFSALSQSPPP